jgi:hypothetical protein
MTSTLSRNPPTQTALRKMTDAEDAQKLVPSQQSDDIFVAAPMQPRASAATPGRKSSSPSRSASGRRTTRQTTESNSLPSVYDEMPHLKPARKRKANGQPTSKAAKQLSDDERIDQPVSKKSRIIEVPARKPSTDRSRSVDHTVLLSSGDIELFTSLLEQEGYIPRRYHTLEVHLDTNKRDEYADYGLAVALNLLHPRPDGTNPHSYRAMKLVVKGKFLYTRYSYKLVSPAVSKYASLPLKKLALSKLSQGEQASLEYKVNSTEKIVAKALLGIRGLKIVCFAGGGRLEDLFAQVLRVTVVQRPGMRFMEPTLGTISAHPGALELFREGTIDSATYQATPCESPDHKDLDRPVKSGPENTTPNNDNSVSGKKRVATSTTRRSDSAALDDEEGQELDMWNLKPMNAVDMNHHKLNWDSWMEWKGLTEDGLAVELGWTI